MLLAISLRILGQKTTPEEWRSTRAWGSYPRVLRNEGLKGSVVEGGSLAGSELSLSCCKLPNPSLTP
jgi:hypothetical protein